MTTFPSRKRTARATRDALLCAGTAFLRDAGHCLLRISRNTLAFVGLAVLAALVFLVGGDDIRHRIETHALGWLQARHGAGGTETASARPPAARPPAAGPPAPLLAEAVHPGPQAVGPPVPAPAGAPHEDDAVSRATAADPRELTRQQAAVAHWLARRYRVAPEPVGRLVKEAWQVAPRFGLDPTLVLAVMAIESSFNPFAQSPVGAQGLMQVMTSVHNGKYERFGGSLAAFDPVTNLKVGVQVLKECIARAGSIEAGLRHYVGAANLPSDGGYAARVLAEQRHLRKVAGGRLVATNVRSVPRVQAAPPVMSTRQSVVAAPGAAAARAAPPAPTTRRAADAEAPNEPYEPIREPGGAAPAA